MKIFSLISNIQKSYIKIFWNTLLVAIIGLSGISQYCSQNFTMLYSDYFAIFRDDYPDFLLQCPIIYSVTRQDLPLGIVKHCIKK